MMQFFFQINQLCIILYIFIPGSSFAVSRFTLLTVKTNLIFFLNFSLQIVPLNTNVNFDITQRISFHGWYWWIYTSWHKHMSWKVLQSRGTRTYMDMIFKVAIKRIFLRRYCCVYSYFFMGCVNILNILKGFLQMTNLFCMVHQLIHQMIERCKHAMIWFIPRKNQYYKIRI